jgi:septal ring factor EnvC (AmiA/AmiB activator)
MIVLGLALAISSAQATPSPQDYIQKRQEYLKKDEQDRNILAQIFEMQKNLKKINHEKGTLVSKRENTQKQIEKLNPLVQSAEGHLLDQKIELQKRLLYISKFQDMNFLKILFSSQAPSELDRNLRILKNFTQRDYLVLKKYFANVKVLKTKKEELSHKIKSVAELEAAVAQKEKQLQSQTKKKNQLLAEIQNQKKNLFQKLRLIRAKATQSVDDLKKQEFLSTILEPLFFEKRGELDLPTKGHIIQKYGYFEHPVYKTQIRNKGVFIQAPLLSDVQAVADGEVVYEEKIPMAGYTIIINHGDHYYSVYSYLGEPLVHLRENVSEGEILATSVSYHPFLGQGMYFELRHFSEPEDPQPWFAARGVL